MVTERSRGTVGAYGAAGVFQKVSEFEGLTPLFLFFRLSSRRVPRV